MPWSGWSTTFADFAVPISLLRARHRAGVLARPSAWQVRASIERTLQTHSSPAGSLMREAWPTPDENRPLKIPTSQPLGRRSREPSPGSELAPSERVLSE